jgi:hypothetical protein
MPVCRRISTRVASQDFSLPTFRTEVSLETLRDDAVVGLSLCVGCVYTAVAMLWSADIVRFVIYARKVLYLRDQHHARLPFYSR